MEKKKFKVKKLWSIGGFDFYGVRVFDPELELIHAIGMHCKEGRKLTEQQMKEVEKDINLALSHGSKIKSKTI
jgi:hypothetical protein